MTVRTLPLLITFLAAAVPAARGQVGNYGQAQRQETQPEVRLNLGSTGIKQRLGERVDLGLAFRDSDGDIVTLRDCVVGRPSILVLAFYRCEQLCHANIGDVVKAARGIDGLDVGRDYNVIVVSFDPKETPEMAGLHKKQYLKTYGRPGAEEGWHFLTGERAEIDALCGQVGFEYEYEKETKTYAHSAGIMFLTPEGVLSRYLGDLSYDPEQVRQALIDSSDGKISTTLADFVFRCLHRYSADSGGYEQIYTRTMNVVSALAALSVVGVAYLVYRLSKSPTVAAPADAGGGGTSDA